MSSSLNWFRKFYSFHSYPEVGGNMNYNTPKYNYVYYLGSYPNMNCRVFMGSQFVLAN